MSHHPIPPLIRSLIRVHRQPPSDWIEAELSAPTPTLPIILVSLLVGFGSSVLGFYLTYRVFGLSAPWGAGVATLTLVAAVSGVSGFLSSLHDSRTVGINIGFSCALTFLLLAFTGFCLVLGIFTATLALLF